MVDDLLRVDVLLAAMQAALPVQAIPTAELAAVMRKDRPGHELPRQWFVTDVSYAGEPGGIMCRLDGGKAGVGADFIVSITHLAFDRRFPFARDIAIYQQRRLKWLRRLGAPRMQIMSD